MTCAPRSKRAFLENMARRYCWDAPDPTALADERRIVRRVMDLGVIDDLLRLEDVIGRDELVATLAAAPPGSLRPRSWHFWHYRLRLTEPGGRPPSMPERRFE